MAGKQNSRRVSLCFLGRGPPMSNCIHNDQGVSVSITTPSLHKPASEKTELKSMNIASQSLCSSLYEPLCDLQLHNTHTQQARLKWAQLLDNVKFCLFTLRNHHLLHTKRAVFALSPVACETWVWSEEFGILVVDFVWIDETSTLITFFPLPYCKTVIHFFIHL